MGLLVKVADGVGVKETVAVALKVEVDVEVRVLVKEGVPLLVGVGE